MTNNEEENPSKKLRTLMEDVKNGDLGSVVGFLPLVKIQVLWSLSTSEDTFEDKWWDAIIVGKTNQMHELPQGEEEEEDDGSLQFLPVYEIRYEPFPPDFPDPEISQVCILDDHHVLDNANDSTLPWRFLGSDWEDDSDEEIDEDKKEIPTILLEEIQKLKEGELNGEISTLTLPSQEDSENMAREFVEKLITELTKKHEKQFGSLARSDQMAITDNVLQIREKLIAKVAGCLSATGKLNAEDAQEIVSSLSNLTS